MFVVLSFMIVVVINLELSNIKTPLMNYLSNFPLIWFYLEEEAVFDFFNRFGHVLGKVGPSLARSNIFLAKLGIFYYYYYYFFG